MKNSIESLCALDVDYQIDNRPHVLPLIASSGYDFNSIDESIEVFEGNRSGHVYGRYGNPTIEAVARKVAMLENYDLDGDGNAILVSSGMAAISTLFLSLFKPGDIIIAQGNIYGGTTELFKKVLMDYGLDIRIADISEQSKLEDVVNHTPGIKGIFIESPSNPNQDCVDLRHLATTCQNRGIVSIIDNTLPTPIFQRPLNHGVDFVIHSTTKFLNGHGNAIGGAIVGKDAKHFNSIWERMKLLGTNPSPFDTWLLHNGMKTLHVRMKAHQENAIALANHLENHDKLTSVRYLGLKSHPHHSLASEQMVGFGSMMAIEIRGGFQSAVRFMNRLELCSLTPTLGDVDTLVLHPVSSSHLKVPEHIREANNITDGLVRISVGIEDVADIIKDIDQALEAA